ncbi:MAG: MarR family transcriptional regulator [Desulfurococcaceae archaeon]
MKLAAHLALILMLGGLCSIGLSQAATPSLPSIRYFIAYNPLEGRGILEVSAQLTLEEPSWVVIPIGIFGDQTRINLLNYTWSNLLVGGLNFQNDTAEIYAFIAGNGTLTMYFGVSALFEETGIGAYVTLIDTTDLASTANNAEVELLLPGEFNIEPSLTRRNATISVIKEKNYTRVCLNGFSELLIIAFIPMTEPPASTPPSSQAPLIIAGAIVAVGIISFAVYYFRRRSKILVERVDYLYDSASRTILKALGEAGAKGLTQAEIVKETGLPKSSVSRRIKRLEDDGIVAVKRVGKYNYISLTDKGYDLYRRIAHQ